VISLVSAMKPQESGSPHGSADEPDLNWGDTLAAHPEWFQRDAEGKPKPAADEPELYATCMFTSYMTDYMTAIIRETNSLYEVDAHFMNGWPPLGICRCATARRVRSCRLLERRPTGTIYRAGHLSMEAV